MKKNKRAVFGFTLLELLLGLALSALIGLIVYQTFWAGIKIESRTQDQNRLMQEARLSFSLMERELQGALFYNFPAEDEKQAAFSGSRSEVQFLKADADGLKFVRYRLVPQELVHIQTTRLGKKTRKNVRIKMGSVSNPQIAYLVREEIPFLKYLQGKEPWEESQEILSPHVVSGSLEFSYLYLTVADKNLTEWSDTWSNEKIPFRIRVQMDLFQGTGKGSPVVLRKEILIPTGTLGEKNDESI